MKKQLLLLSLICSAFIAAAQPPKSFTRKEIKSVAWGNESVSFVSGYWDMAKPQLDKSMGKKLSDSIDRYVLSIYKPNWLDNEKGKAAAKMYLVAVYNNNFNGSFHGVEYVVMVPYEENKENGSNVSHTDFFLVFPKDAVELK